MFKQGVDVTEAAGAGYKLLQVLNGTTDLYFHSTYIKKWDLCAGRRVCGYRWEGQWGRGVWIQVGGVCEYRWEECVDTGGRGSKEVSGRVDVLPMPYNIYKLKLFNDSHSLSSLLSLPLPSLPPPCR